MRGQVTATSKSQSDKCDLVTEADLVVSQMIVQGLRSRFPYDLVVSEEEPLPRSFENLQNLWLVDPIDGTENYASQDGQYSVMIGLVIGGIPSFGWIAIPEEEMTYFGGAGYGAWSTDNVSKPKPMPEAKPFADKDLVRLMMGNRDRAANTWLESRTDIEWYCAGSVGIRVVKIILGDADAYIHFSNKLKPWDTAGPVALAFAAQLEVFEPQSDHITYDLDHLNRTHSVSIGRMGTSSWCQKLIDIASSKTSV